MESFKIILYSIFAAIIYGVLHDLITAHVCVEYFSEFHPRLITSESPLVLALLWGVLATWWVGLILGIILALTARAGMSPKRSAQSLIRPIILLMTISAGFAAIAGVSGYLVGKNGVILLIGSFFDGRDADWLARFQADLFAHQASYAVSFFGGIILAILIVRSRRILAATTQTKEISHLE